MCESCSPLCGTCKPAAYKAVICPGCGKPRLLTRAQCLDYLRRPHRRAADRAAGESGSGVLAAASGSAAADRALAGEGAPGGLACEGCGADLLPALERQIEPQPCAYSGIICGYPCGRRLRARGADDAPCATQVPLGRLA